MAVPYDPLNWLYLAGIYHRLLYPELSVSVANRALDLIHAGMNITYSETESNTSVSHRVRVTVARRLSANHPFIIQEHLQDLRFESYNVLIVSLLYCNAHWEGLREIYRATEMWPNNEDFASYKQEFKTVFRERMASVLDLNYSAQEKIENPRKGSVFKKQYPWMAKRFFTRSPELLENINEELCRSMASDNCEVKSLASPRSNDSIDRGGDVGPLGMFATRDIEADEFVLRDLGVSMMSNLAPDNPDKRYHCDACQGLLPDQGLRIHEGGVHPDCCKEVKYCGPICLEASRRYHRVLCKQDFAWLYKATAGKRHNNSWFPILLLRIFAIILGDMRHRPSKDGPPIKHPLEHPLVARLTAGYQVQKPNSYPQIWTYYGHVEVPTKILTQLGVDIFSCSEWSPEVIHTIYWRLANNACVSTTTTIGYHYDDFSAFKSIDVFGISPHYVFFNHSCDPSVEWTSTGQGRHLGWEKVWHISDDVKNKRRGMVCKAVRAIKKGEEVRIAYVPAGAVSRRDLTQWFEGGCGCGACAVTVTVDSDSE